MMPQKSTALTITTSDLAGADEQLPALIAAGNSAAQFAYEEFIFGTIANEGTRVAYRRAINQFLAWCEKRGLELTTIAPKHVGQYLKHHPGAPTTKKQHLAAIRHLFDALVQRHGIILNPATSVRTERYEVIEGKTPELTVKQARQLLDSIDTDHVVGLRDRAIIGTLCFTAVRCGAVARLKRGDFQHGGDQWTLRFTEKGGKSRDIPVRHDLQQYLLDYLDAAHLRRARQDTPLFRSTVRREKRLTSNSLTAGDMWALLKRRLKDAGLPDHLSPHSIRVGVITNLLEQGVSLEDVQYLAGHADSRTTKVYDRRHRKITRNIVERISI